MLPAPKNFAYHFNPMTCMSFTIPVKIRIRLVIHKLRGQEIAEPLNQELLPGKHQVTFNTAALPTGLYFYRLETGSNLMTRKMMLIK